MANSINSLIQEDKLLLDGTPIPKEEALQLIKNFRDSQGWGSNKTRAVWFSSDEIREILEMIAKVDNGDGVRIYFGMYADNQTGVPPEYKSKCTLVYVPTTIRVNPGGGYSHRNIFDVETLLESDLTATTNDGEEGYNHGELCPPKCG